MKGQCQIFLALVLMFCFSMTQAQQPPDFEAEKAAGIFEYEVEKVIEKLKITDDSTKQSVKDALYTYNKEMFNLSLENATTFKDLNDEFDRNVKIAMQNRDRSQMDGVKAKIQQVIPPIRKQVAAEEMVLNNTMKGVLSEKQNEKWLKYQKRKKG